MIGAQFLERIGKEGPARPGTLVIMKTHRQARHDHGCVVGHVCPRDGLAVDIWTEARPHVRPERPAAHVARGRPESAVDGTGGRRFRRTRRQRRERLPAGPRREGRRQAARARTGQRQGTVDVRLRRARHLHVRRLPHDADRGRRARLHRRPDGRSVRDQHENAAARLAQEHLEGLRRRRPAAAVGHRAEPVDLRRSADRGAADTGDRCRRLRQADGRDQMEVCRRCPAFRVTCRSPSSRWPARIISS